ncbi:hypothetical protein NKG94_44465 [Micromonospora sp. M12]
MERLGPGATPLPRRPAWAGRPSRPAATGARRAAGAPDACRSVGRRGHRRLGPALRRVAPLPPTMPYPTPPATRQWSGPPAPRSGRTRCHRPLPETTTGRPRPPQAAASPCRPGRCRRPRRHPRRRRKCRSSAGAAVHPACDDGTADTTAGLAGPRGTSRPGPSSAPSPLAVAAAAHACLLLRLPAYYGFPISAQYPARAVLPDQVEDLSLRQDDRSVATARQLEGEMRTQHWLAEDAFAGVYSTTSGKRVTIFGGTGFRVTPSRTRKPRSAGSPSGTRWPLPRPWTPVYGAGTSAVRSARRTAATWWSARRSTTAASPPVCSPGSPSGTAPTC